MKSNIVAASILGVCLIIAAVIFSGRYYFFRINSCSIASGDRWTGKVHTLRDPNGTNCPKWWAEYE